MKANKILEVNEDFKVEEVRKTDVDGVNYVFSL
jgi:hypothetical protein